MINSRNRFKGHKSLNYLFARGQNLRGLPSSTLRVRHIANHRRHHYRLAIIVSKKVNKKAVVRNRIRRRLYEFFRCHLGDLQQVDLAVIVYSDSLATMPATELSRICQPIVAQIKAIHALDSRPRNH